MSNLFFWILILSLLIPLALRMYRKSVDRRNREQGFHDRYPQQFPGQFPGSAGPQSRQPRDGFTQQDYFAGGFRSIEQQPGSAPRPLPDQYGQPPMPPAGGSQPAPEQPAAPATPPPPSGPQGYRARKLAELDRQYSNGELSMEEYMARRGEIMNG